MILPDLTYGSQTRDPTKIELSKLQICQRKMERKLLYIPRGDWTRNEAIRRTTKIKKVVATRVTYTTWSWAGHVIRMKPVSWPHVRRVRQKENRGNGVQIKLFI